MTHQRVQWEVSIECDTYMSVYSATTTDQLLNTSLRPDSQCYVEQSLGDSNPSHDIVYCSPEWIRWVDRYCLFDYPLTNMSHFKPIHREHKCILGRTIYHGLIAHPDRSIVNLEKLCFLFQYLGGFLQRRKTIFPYLTIPS